VMGLAIALTAAPFSFRFSGSELKFLVARDAPWAAAGLYCAALGCWVAFVGQTARLTARGLVVPGSLAGWIAGAVAIFTPAAVMLQIWTGTREPLTSFIAAGAIGAFAGIAARKTVSGSASK
jgi:hypothetical protein